MYVVNQSQKYAELVFSEIDFRTPASDVVIKAAELIDRRVLLIVAF